jgi:hypothetical protein
MKRKSAAKPPVRETDLRGVVWRLNRLERQVKTMSELIRDHAEDADRLVRIVGEDHELLRRQLLRQHLETIRRRKRAQALSRPAASKDLS